MECLKNLNKKLKLKTQLILFFSFTLILSLIMSIAFISCFLFAFFNKKQALQNQLYASKNSNLILDISFKDELEKQIYTKHFNYWIVNSDLETIYSYNNDELPDTIYMSSNNYLIKYYNSSDKNTYIFTFTPLIVDGKLQGGFIQKYNSNSIADASVINFLIEKIGINSFYFLTIIPIGMFLIPITILLISSSLFSSLFDKNLKKLITISKRIQNNDLNFDIDLSYENEIGDVLIAINDMKSALENSLKEQWLIYQQRKDMICTITHELKTPISVIYGHLELISINYDKLSYDEKVSYLNLMLNNADKIKIFVNQLNEIWDLERPELSLNIQLINLREFIKDIKKTFSHLCNEKAVNLEINLYDTENDCYHFDKFRIEEVISNIITNSLKYTNENDTILLECFCKNNLLTFKISDNGKGFTDESDVIFDKFHKNNDNIIYKNSSGLGLYICKLIIQKHNGEIIAYNNNNNGATIEFSLPII